MANEGSNNKASLALEITANGVDITAKKIGGFGVKVSGETSPEAVAAFTNDFASFAETVDKYDWLRRLANIAVDAVEFSTNAAKARIEKEDAGWTPPARNKKSGVGKARWERKLQSELSSRSGVFDSTGAQASMSPKGDILYAGKWWSFDELVLFSKENDILWDIHS